MFRVHRKRGRVYGAATNGLDGIRHNTQRKRCSGNCVATKAFWPITGTYYLNAPLPGRTREPNLDTQNFYEYGRYSSIHRYSIQENWKITNLDQFFQTGKQVVYCMVRRGDFSSQQFTRPILPDKLNELSISIVIEASYKVRVYHFYSTSYIIYL